MGVLILRQYFAKTRFVVPVFLSFTQHKSYYPTDKEKPIQSNPSIPKHYQDAMNNIKLQRVPSTEEEIMEDEISGMGCGEFDGSGELYHDHDDDDDGDDDYEEGLVGGVVSPMSSPRSHANVSQEDQFRDEDPFEAASLMTSSTVEDEEELGHSRGFRMLVVLMISALIVAFLALLLPGMFSKSDTLESLRTPARLPVTYDCPEVFVSQNRYELPNFENSYQNVTNQITDNMTEFLETFRNTDFEEWGKDYDTVKQGMYHWKSTRYPDYLKDGDSIYESACGIGLNLYMTLEILQEVKGIENLFVYGSDHIENNAAKADAVFNNIAPAHGQKGVICPGDSVNLYFVPDNSFDLVYTGHISPILDPLHFGLSNNENYGHYTALCQTSDEDWKGTKLQEMAQNLQNNWYGTWISEMTRVAKPGVPVIIEQVSQEYCSAAFDWGGVSKQWFTDSVVNNTYGWNIQPDSLEFEDDIIFRERYHVFMLKKEEEHTNAAQTAEAEEEAAANAAGTPGVAGSGSDP